jgi:spore coat polysaccharide biosynthesis predicted glycosyltransferase SpsG
MKVAFRTDATNKIGTGHFMRCLTLACELKKQGAHILFLSRNLPKHLNDILCTKGIEYIPLNFDEVDGLIDDLTHASWLGASQSQDSKASIKALSEQVWDWLVVDHYAIDHRWETKLRKLANRILVIDDLADRQHDCDLLLDQNFYQEMDTRYVGKVPQNMDRKNSQDRDCQPRKPIPINSKIRSQSSLVENRSHRSFTPSPGRRGFNRV